MIDKRGESLLPNVPDSTGGTKSKSSLSIRYISLTQFSNDQWKYDKISEKLEEIYTIAS